MRSPFTLACLLCAVLFVGVVVSGNDDKDKDERRPDDARVQRGFAITPVKLTFKQRDRDLVGLGSYIVNAQGACNDCHTCPSFEPGHNPYDGKGDGKINGKNYLAGGAPFGPVLRSANLTPDPVNGLPERGNTFEEFRNLIQTGHDPGPPPHTLQVMPWPVYRYMVNDDLRAIYAFLRAIPPANPGACGGPGE